MTFRLLNVVAPASLVCLMLLQPVYSAKPTGLLANFQRAGAVLESSRGVCLLLDIYIARTREQQSQGLMFVEQMDEFEGMLFIYGRPAQLTMWMKNTYIPLDMVFMNKDGEIASIVKNTTPQSTKRISSGRPVTMVLELNAGFTDRWEIERGNRLLLVE